MPVMHRRDIGRQWLEIPIGDELELSLRTQPVLSEELEAYAVSTLVNSPDNDSPECVRRVRQQTRNAQLSLGNRS
jgi:putative SOS response-associated peptidase YedK